MKITGSSIHYLLRREFGDIACDGAARRIRVDYPIVLDRAMDMRGHAVVVPEGEAFEEGMSLEGALCVCLDGAAAQSARDAGIAVIEVRGTASFPRVSNYLQQLYVRAKALDTQLRAYVDASAGFQKIVDACVSAIGIPCAIVDEQYRGVYRSSSEASEAVNQASDMLESDAIDLFMASRGYRHMRASRGVFTMPGTSDLLMKNIFSDGRLVGTMVMRHSEDALSARYVHCVLDYFVRYVEGMYARIGSFDMPAIDSGRVRMALLEAVGGDSAAAARLQATLVEAGHDRGARYVVLRIERSFTNEGPEENDYLARRFELAWPQAYCFVVEGNLYMLASVGKNNSDTERAFLRELPIAARENLSKVGISRPFFSMDQLATARLQASGALECGNALDPTRWCYRFKKYDLNWLVLRAKGDERSASIVHPALTALEEYDAAHGSELVNTLAVFMRCRYNASAAAQELYIARSTLLNRLDRIVRHTGIDLADPDERLYLGLSFALSDIENRVGGYARA